VVSAVIHRQRRRRRRQSGYSLLEIIIVVAIIGLLVTLVAPQLFGRLDQSRTTTAQAQARMLHTALDAYRLDTGAYPSESDGLSVLVNAPSGDALAQWRGPYLDGGSLPLDPWGRPYHYAPSNGVGAPAIYSLGADGRPGGTGVNSDVGSLPQNGTPSS